MEESDGDGTDKASHNGSSDLHGSDEDVHELSTASHMQKQVWGRDRCF